MSSPLSLLFWLAAVAAASSSSRSASSFDCLPGEPCWPSLTQWASFNSTLDGRLRITEPWASPCYDSQGSSLCAMATMNSRNDTARAAIYGATQNLQWQACGAQSCNLNPAHKGQCSLGALSAYYINATTAKDVQHTIDFVRNTGVRLSIKNSGHDYFGRSVAPNSLALWTRNIQNYGFHEKFAPEGCSDTYENIGVIGAGVSAGEAASYFKGKGMDITLGALGSVGAAGGFGQGAGHGPLGPKHGLMVDQAVEFDVVTADGVLRTINACQEPDLFWAMRGGGGGTYAVLINYKFKVYPSVPFHTYSFLANITDATQDWVYRAIFHQFVESQQTWSSANMSGYNFFSRNKIETHLVWPADQPLSSMIDLSSKWADFLTSLPGMSITKHAYERFATYSDWASDSDYRGIIARNAPGGMAVVESGRLVPRALFASPENRTALVDALVDGMDAGCAADPRFQVQVYATTPVHEPDAERRTSAHRAWRDALWTLDFVSGYAEGAPREVVDGLWAGGRAAMRPLKALTPGGGCYVNEGDYGEPEWEETFFGENYARLLEVKERWDPSRLFNCWKCVGWTGPGDRMYSCYGAQPRPTERLPECGGGSGAGAGTGAGDGLKQQEPEGLPWDERLGLAFSEEL